MSSRDTSRTKLRGGRRYFRRLAAWPERIQVKLGGDSWYDLWHVHPDFFGWSKINCRARRAHLRVLFEAFERVLRGLADSAEPGQVFISVNTKDSPGDALYVHTPNPNGTAFPYDFAGYRWEGFHIPEWLDELVDHAVCEVGEIVSEGERVYAVTPRGRRGRTTK